MRRLAPAAVALAAACTNPTIDPDAPISVVGTALDEVGDPLVDAEVQLVKYWSESNERQPLPERLLDGRPGSASDGDLRVELVRRGYTDRRGDFYFELYGEDVAQPGGYVDGRGRQEVADTVIVVRDPFDPYGRSGVLSYEHTFQQSDRSWTTGILQLWFAAAEVEADVGGELVFSWDASLSVRDARAYRLIVESPNGQRRLVLGCGAGAEACVRVGGRVERRVPAFTVDSYYRDRSGELRAWVQADLRDYRAVAAVDVLDDGVEPGGISGPNDLVEGVWAASDVGEQDLSFGAALDGDPATRAYVDAGATEIYVKLRPAVITDAGVLGALLSRAADGCVELEFTGTQHRDVVEARLSSDRDWQPRGRFCGENGGPGEVSAVVSFAASGGVTFAWMRLRARPGLVSGVTPVFREIGEVAVFSRR